jgi:hypothetical protein
VLTGGAKISRSLLLHNASDLALAPAARLAGTVVDQRINLKVTTAAIAGDEIT